ncbi:helix-turn-helix domain-containing protein [Chelativorans alearense]|uniref:helix-turn-helix domain-containing protein n=1 Tax=Chelativorans alearense TaxID=2681495 RepID=UPI0013CF4C47|nr:helix-turn-helix domain-containing protein [Chelativorans alearense]
MIDKPIYAPLPARAMGDKRLSGEDFRVLMAVSAHDRLGANGIGCFASHTRLAALVGCHEKSLSRSLARLVECGYVEAGRHPINRRTRTYRIKYIKFDGEYLASTKAATGNKSATYKPGIGSNFATLGEAIGNKPAPEAVPIGNKPNQNSQKKQIDNSDNIFSETVINPVETESKHPAEATPTAGKRAYERAPSRSIGSNLGLIERLIKNGLNDDQARQWLEWLDEIENGSLSGDDFQRASRLRSQLGERLNAA